MSLMAVERPDETTVSTLKVALLSRNLVEDGLCSDGRPRSLHTSKNITRSLNDDDNPRCSSHSITATSITGRNCENEVVLVSDTVDKHL